MKLGMLGMWHAHADGIVRRVAENPREFTLVGFYDPDPAIVAQRRPQWEQRIAGFRTFDRPEQLLAEPLDGVVVEGRVFENLKLARLALESGRPVLLEKPAGERLDEFKQLIDLAQKKHLHLQMTYLFRYMSAVLEMLKRAQAGNLGDVYEFRARLPKDLPSYQRNAAEVGRYKGGMFFEMAGHVIDMMITILGPPKSVTPFMAHHHTDPPADFIDNGVAVFGFDRAWGIVEIPALEVAPRSRRIEVYGTKGACVIPHLGSGHLTNKDIQPIETYQAGETDWQTHSLQAATLQIADLREFAAVVGRKKKPNYTLEHDLAVQDALLKASGMA